MPAVLASLPASGWAEVKTREEKRCSERLFPYLPAPRQQWASGRITKRVPLLMRWAMRPM
eukprot:14974068-Alexandrium_andersonii.AAC.1